MVTYTRAPQFDDKDRCATEGLEDPTKGDDLWLNLWLGG